MIDYRSSIPSQTFETAHDDMPTLPLWTFALGLFAILAFGLTSVPAIICGHRALAEARGSSNEGLGRSVALTGLMIGYVGAVLLGTWVILLAKFLAGS